MHARSRKGHEFSHLLRIPPTLFPTHPNPHHKALDTLTPITHITHMPSTNNIGLSHPAELNSIQFHTLSSLPFLPPPLLSPPPRLAKEKQKISYSFSKENIQSSQLSSTHAITKEKTEPKPPQRKKQGINRKAVTKDKAKGEGMCVVVG